MSKIHIEIQGRIRGRGEGRSPLPPRRLLVKNWDAKPIKSWFYQSQNVPKISFLSSKIEKKLWEGGTATFQTPPRWGGDTLSHIPPSILASWLAFGARGASGPGAFIRPLATTSGSASVEIRMPAVILTVGGRNSWWSLSLRPITLRPVRLGYAFILLIGRTLTATITVVIVVRCFFKQNSTVKQ